MISMIFENAEANKHYNVSRTQLPHILYTSASALLSFHYFDKHKNYFVFLNLTSNSKELTETS